MDPVAGPGSSIPSAPMSLTFPSMISRSIDSPSLIFTAPSLSVPIASFPYSCHRSIPPARRISIHARYARTSTSLIGRRYFAPTAVLIRAFARVRKRSIDVSRIYVLFVNHAKDRTSFVRLYVIGDAIEWRSYDSGIDSFFVSSFGASARPNRRETTFDMMSGMSF